MLKTWRQDGSKGEVGLDPGPEGRTSEGEGLPVERWRCAGSRVEECPMKL